jgi:uncharacterized protein (DUF1330 family)
MGSPASAAADYPRRMTLENLVGMHVTDDDAYARYRAAMTPLLHAHGGDFRMDFRIAEELRPPATHPINRLFVIAFPDRARKDAFFGHPDYAAIREQHFAPSVAAFTVLAEYER